MIDIEPNLVVFALIASSIAVLVFIAVFRKRIAAKRADSFIVRRPAFKNADRDSLIKMYIDALFSSAVVAILAVTIVINTMYSKLNGQPLFIKNSNIVLGVILAITMFFVLKTYYTGLKRAMPDLVEQD